MATTTRSVWLITVLQNGTELNNGIQLTFRNPPIASFTTNSPICVGNALNLNNNSCPTTGLISTPWDYGDGTTGTSNSHTYPASGNYTVSLTVENQCGTATATQQVQVLELPVSNPVVTEGVKEILGDTLVVCVGDTLCLNGDSLSLHETSWRWDFLTNISNNCFDYDPPPTSNPQDVSLLPRPKLIFFCDGIYRLELRVNNPCNAPDTKVLIFKVVRPPVVAFSLNVSDCTPTLTVNPANSLQVTAGQLTGCLWDFGPQGTSTLCDPGPVTFGASTPVTFTGWNQCDTVTLTGQVSLTPSGQAIITSPCPDTLCTSDPPCTLAVNLPGGNWTNNGAPATAIFNPATANIGLNTLTYGAPPCIAPAQVQVFVINSTINGPTTLCMDAGPTPYTATPTGGIFSSSKNAIDQATGQYNPATAGPGTDTIFYQTPGNAFCQGSAFLVVQVVQLNVGIQVTDCNGLSISFATTAGTSPFTSILWNFGDGQTSTQSAPTHTYATAGTYTVSATIMASGCTASATLPVSIVEPPSANFSLSFASPACGPLPVAVTNLSTGGNLSYEWDIGGTIVQGFDPGPVSLVNTATITLTASNDCGTSTHSELVEVAPSPIAGFGANAYVCSGEVLEVFNVAMLYDSLFWDFGNGQTSTSTAPVLPLAYFTDTDNDTVQIMQIAFNDCGPDTMLQTVVVVPTDAQAQVTTTAAPLFQVCQNEAVCFQSFSLPSGIPLLWDFADGNTTIAHDVCHTWAAPGIYEVVAKLVSCGFDSTVIVVTVLPAPAAAFVPPNTACPGEAVFFENMSSGAIGHTWDFGDGAVSTLVSPGHAYGTAGSYEACLIVTSANGCRDTLCQTVTVAGLPTADFTLANPGCQGDPVVFTNASSPDVVNCAWVFGDGNGSAVCNPVHTFVLPGPNNVTLTVTNASGCQASASQTLLVGELPLPDFTFTPTAACHPAAVQFTNTSQLADGYGWDFGDGNTSTLTNPQHTYLLPGSFTAVLTAIADGVCEASFSQNITVHEMPQAQISLPQTSLCAGGSLLFQSASTGTITAHEWAFGDGIFSFETNPVHQYTAPGTYTVTLTVRNGTFCSDTETLTVTVHPPVLATFAITDATCHGGTDGALAAAVTGGTPPFQFTWSNGVATADLTDLPAGVYALQITDANGCTLQQSLTVQQPPALQLELASEDVVTCSGGTDGGLCLTPGGGTPGYVVFWENGGSGPCIADVPAGSYAVSLTDANGCLLSAAFEVRENPPIMFADSVQHRPCFGEDVAFIRIEGVQGGVGSHSVTLEGMDGYYETGNTFGKLVPGVYLLTVTDALGCFTEKNYVITEPDSIWLDIRDDSIHIELGEVVVLKTGHNLAQPLFSWQPPDGLGCTDCPEPVASPNRDTEYRLTATDANGCTLADRVFVSVDVVRTVYIPNTFTPNDDGRNDRFRIRTGAKSIRQVRAFRIFDRWGELVFEALQFDPAANHLEDSWDGSFRGRELAPDVFLFYAEIEFVDGVVEIEKGEVMLVR